MINAGHGDCMGGHCEVLEAPAAQPYALPLAIACYAAAALRSRHRELALAYQPKK
jgi:hypothetical protein